MHSKKKTRTLPQPRLTWRAPSSSRVLVTSGQLPEACALDANGEEKPGPVFEEKPTPEQVQQLGLRAWFECKACKLFRPCPAGYGTPGYCGGTGYGGSGRAPVCYRCCGERDKEAMRKDGRATLYLVRKADKAEATTGTLGREPYVRAENWSVQNWPGSLALPVLSLKTGKHNWRDVTRTDVWFVFEGFVWHGVRLGDADILRARRTRTEWRDKGEGRGYGPFTPRKSRAKKAKVSA